jgi:hypothetical protein
MAARLGKIPTASAEPLAIRGHEHAARVAGCLPPGRTALGLADPSVPEGALAFVFGVGFP